MRASVFRAHGGFDEALACHEDYELGARLIGAGVDLRFEPRAAAVHHECTTLDRALARKRAEGVADVQIARRHPRLLPTMPLGWFEGHSSRRQRWLRALSFAWPSAAEAVAAAFRQALRPLEAGRLRGRWQRVLDDLLTHHYWLGVKSVLPSRTDLRRFITVCAASTSDPSDVLTLELAGSPVDDVLRLADQRRPHAVRLLWNGALVGEIADEPGVERLRGVHVRRALAQHLALPLLGVLNQQGVVGVRQQQGALITNAVPRTTLGPGLPS
jgi:hypothetical protein